MMSGISGEIRITVDTEQLKAAGESADGYIQQMKTAYDDLDKAVRKMGDYWIGEASEKERQVFFSQKENIEVVIRHLSEYPVDLMTIAGVYEEHESSNVEVPDLLSGEMLI